MARRERRPSASRTAELTPQQTECWVCHKPLWVAYHNKRRVTTLEGVVQLRLKIRRCVNQACRQYHKAYRPEEEGQWALPQGEFGLDVIALVGSLRYQQQRSVPEIHQHLRARGVAVSERTVTNLLYRYEELVALHLTHPRQLQAVLQAQERVILALDGLQPDVGHEVLWVVRDCLSGRVVLARSLLSACGDDLAALLREAQTLVAVPIAAVLSDGQLAIRKAVAAALPGVPHQLCHFHYLRAAAQPIYEADRHAKKELKKQLRGVRPLERQAEGQARTWLGGVEWRPMARRR